MTDSTETNKFRFIPSVGDLICVAVLYFLVFVVPGYVLGAGPIARDIVMGQYILMFRALPHRDIISYTFGQGNWIPHGWLFNLAIAYVKSIAELNGIVVMLAAATAAFYLLLYKQLRKTGGNLYWTTILIIVAIGASLPAIQFDAGALCTWFGFFFFAHYLNEFCAGRMQFKRCLIALAILMIFWANAHLEFFFGPLFVLLCLVGQVLQQLSNDDQHRNGVSTGQLLLIFAATLIAPVVNPYGLQLYSSAMHNFAQNVFLPGSPLLSPVFHGGLQSISLELLYGLFLFALAFSQKRLSIAQLSSCLIFGALSLVTVNNVAPFVIVVLPITISLLREIPFAMFSTSKVGKWSTKFDRWELTSQFHLLPSLAILFLSWTALNGGQAFDNVLLSCDFDPLLVPRNTTEAIRTSYLGFARGFNDASVGDYIRYKLGMRVFLDDRRDFYPPQFIQDHDTVINVLPGWQKVLDKNLIFWIICMKNGPLAGTLSQNPGWSLLTSDQVADIYTRRTTIRPNAIK